ncbi:hypothetical protein [Sphingorhabdus sp.]|jgi:hypothetical protein|uniref:hypothetical protein n=1 Tax=Sphingorhabdus sp. TaxID=1902408 RepID=UPI0037835FC8
MKLPDCETNEAGRVAPQSSLKSVTKLGSDVTHNNYSKTPNKGKKNALAVPAPYQIITGAA